MNFEEAIEHVLAKEGGYTNDPRDSGNWTGGIINSKGIGILKGTKFGISAKAYPSLDIKNLTRDQAIDIYRRDYWLKIRADELPRSLRLNVFDFAVNAGIGTAIKTLQNACGVKKDGIIGPNTLSGAQSVTSRNFSVSRIRHYTGLVRDRAKDSIFLDGWLIRTLDVTLISML
jgi:lysozyme family protein